jgi:SAM-dependent methyltransferase
VRGSWSRPRRTSPVAGRSGSGSRVIRIGDLFSVVDPVAGRRRLSRHLIGRGVEVGPGHNPFVLPFPGASVQYVDRWNPSENAELFPELDPEAFPCPDIIANFDEDRLVALGDESQDFVICSHVLEHLADPLGFLADIYRVLRPGGTVLILLPDRHRTSDHLRAPTPLSHLVADYEAGVTRVDDAHVEEFLSTAYPSGTKTLEQASTVARQELIDLHRRRSVHVHCWDEEEFSAVLSYAVEHLGQRWELVDGLLTEEAGPSSIEFGYLLRRSSADLGAFEAAGRLRQSIELSRREALAAVVQLEQLSSEVVELRSSIGALQATKTFRYSARMRSAYGKLRKAVGRRA